MSIRIDRAGRSPALTTGDVVAISHAASVTSGPPALLTALACLLPCPASTIATARVEDVDRARGTIFVHHPVEGRSAIVLGYMAALLVELAAGERAEGWLVDDGFGGPTHADADTLDFARELVSAEKPGLRTDWTFEGISDAVFDGMTDAGTRFDVVVAQTGIGGELAATFPGSDLLRRASADLWAATICFAPPSAFGCAQIVIAETEGRPPSPDRRRLSS